MVHRRSVATSDRARTDGVTEGEIVVVTVGGRIVGHAIRPHAGELIHELVLAARARLKLSNLAESMHIYPTYSTVTGQIVGDDAFHTAHRVRALAQAGRVRLNASGPVAGLAVDGCQRAVQPPSTMML